MQLNRMRKLPRFSALIVYFTLFLMLVSTSYRCEVHFQQHYLLPCVYQVFEVPEKQTSYGFPMFWLMNVEGTNQIGCGPIVGKFSTYSFIWQGFLVDSIFYAFCCSLIVCFINKTHLFSS